jgi:release factor glutamine methyltransferase
MKNNPTINTVVNELTQDLAQFSDTPRLDAELLTATVLQNSRSWLFSHWDEALTDEQRLQLQNLSARRRSGEPMAYILEHKEFWGLKLSVTPSVLVPRPETEHLVEWILANFPATSPLQLADLGTGSGAIALALAVERPVWRIDAADNSQPALLLAQQNAADHQLQNIQFYLGEWCKALPKKRYHILVSNPPYIAEADPHLQKLTYEPRQALASGPEGLDAIREIIEQAPNYLLKTGFLVLEHGYNQAEAVSQLLRERGFTNIQIHFDLANQPRFITAGVVLPARAT